MSAPKGLPLDTESKWQELIGFIRVGKTLGTAARMVGMNRRAVTAYLESHPERAAEYMEAEQEATEKVEEVLYEEALARQKWAVQMWLERRDKDRWSAAAEDGPRRVVLDPAALKGMLNAGPEVEATVIEDNTLPGAGPHPAVPAAPVAGPDPEVQ